MGQRKRGTIPIHLGPNKSPEDVAVGGLDLDARMINCMTEIVGDQVVVMSRPGLLELTDTGTSSPILGLEWSEVLSKAFVWSNQHGFTINDSSGTKTSLTDDAGLNMNAARIIMAQGPSSTMYAAGGHGIGSLTASAVGHVTDGDAPSSVGFVAFLDQYLLAQEIGTQKCHRSDVGDPTAWGSNWFSAEGKYDYLRAIGSENLEVLLLCDKSGEIWYDTGASDPFARRDGGYIATGIIAPFSLKWCGSPIDSWVWLDTYMNLVRLSGTTPTVLSSYLNKYLQRDAINVIDAKGDFFNCLGHPLYMLTLDSGIKTYVYDFSNGLVYKWSTWNSGTSAHDYWKGHISCIAPAWSYNLIGDRSNGKVYRLDEDTSTDDGDDVKIDIITEHIDRGDAGATKICNYIELGVKLAGVVSITISVQYRDNSSEAWTTAQDLVFASGTTGYPAYQVKRLRRLGRYKTRQWRFTSANLNRSVIFPPLEDYEVVYP